MRDLTEEGIESTAITVSVVWSWGQGQVCGVVCCRGRATATCTRVQVEVTVQPSPFAFRQSLYLACGVLVWCVVLCSLDYLVPRVLSFALRACMYASVIKHACTRVASKGV